MSRFQVENFILMHVLKLLVFDIQNAEITYFFNFYIFKFEIFFLNQFNDVWLRAQYKFHDNIVTPLFLTVI